MSLAILVHWKTLDCYLQTKVSSSVILLPAVSVISKVWSCLNCLILGHPFSRYDLLRKVEVYFEIIRNNT